ncbi:MAG TPA: response regulator transcription factor [Anaerolineae bacterium]|nr:response regulator transcription factor [Anaerolineae bacterium]HID85632.1 response regulator transcription factor [Anaerolineales bacterium]HIQ08141.1 response regulator transcription factor [Anaerolineaceae bacterium]
MENGKDVSGRILWIEGRRATVPPFVAAVRRKGYEVHTVPSGQKALAAMASFRPHLIVLYAASFASSGIRISRRLREAAPDIPQLLILGEKATINGNPPADIILHLPFTARKLLNRICRLLPTDGRRILRVGPITLDVDNRRVQCLDKDSRLTPRMSELLQVLLENPGVPLRRDELFAKVWKTDYTADTRTLDVHISWLRRAIEPDPSHPRFIKTVRGIGYQLDID